MGNVRVETTKSELHPSPPEGSGAVLYKKMQDGINNYWGSAAEEKRFIIPFWQVRKLIQESATHQIALKVTNIENPALVDATWVSFNQNDPEASGVPAATGVIGWLQSLLQSLQSVLNPSPDVAFFVFGEDLFPLDSNANFTFFTPHLDMTVLGRIGRGENGETAVYFVVGQIIIRIAPGGSGGLTSGAKIPSGDPDE